MRRFTRAAVIGAWSRGFAALKGLIHTDSPDSTESRAGTRQVINAPAAPDSGAIAHAKSAVALHLGSDGQATPLASFRASTGSANTPRREVIAGHRTITVLCAIERAPEPEPPQERNVRTPRPKR